MQNALQEMEVKYEVQKKDMDIELKQATIDQQQKRQILFIGGLIAAGLLLTLLTYIIVLRNRRNRELAETNAIKDRFFSIISHDLKNPAISQRNAIQTLLENTGTWDTEILRKYYQTLLSSADHQVELLYNLLNWAYVQTKRLHYSPEFFDLTAQLRTDIALIQYMADIKNIRLNVNLPEHALVTGDCNMLTTVVRNLVTNAVKFTNNGGQVTLEVSPCRDGMHSVSTKHTITISDTGTGMSEEQVRNLLSGRDVARNVSTHRGTAGEQGSGLGLIVCKELLEKHGSVLHVESEDGKGSRFWFTV
jgi:signal transduction histidine kinase